jgi:hypothetical protein
MPRPTTLRTDPAAGDLRLLHDLAVLRLVTDIERVPARKRLERTLGADFARPVRALLAETAEWPHERYKAA